MGREDVANGADSTRPIDLSRTPTSWPPYWPLIALIVFAGMGLALYRPALHGPFISDDIGYIVSSPYTRDLSFDSICDLFDPGGDANFYTANYAPVHLLLTAIERNLFGNDFLGYHVVNVLIHALNAVLVVALLRRSRLPAGVALAGGLFFSLHPANVEAVAWISQLKTNASLALSLGAVLAFPRRALLATALFAVALLTKASAAFALPLAATFWWLERPEASRGGRWLVGWSAIFAVYAIPQFGFFGATGGVEVPAYDDPFVQLRTIANLGTRYVAMAATGYGVSAFQEPPPARSVLDPWWLASIPIAIAAIWRIRVVAASRSQELAYWVAVATAFAPVSQVFPFLIPFADRYLYFILPGLIGVAAFLWIDVYDRLGRSTAVAWGTCAVLGLLLVWFGVSTSERAKLWTNETLLNLDAALHYPDGGTAALMAARSAAQRGDSVAAIASLRRAAAAGVDQFSFIAGDPGLAPIRDDPAFVAFLKQLAGLSLERTARREDPTAPELRMAARAHIVREEYREAEALLERAIRMGGPFEPAIRADLAKLREGLEESPPREPSTGSEDERHRPQDR